MTRSKRPGEDSRRSGTTLKRPTTEAPRSSRPSDDLDLGWSAPPPSIRSLPPTSRRMGTSLPPIDVDPTWISLHSLAPAPVVRDAPPPIPRRDTIPVDPEWVEEVPRPPPLPRVNATKTRPSPPRPKPPRPSNK